MTANRGTNERTTFLFISIILTCLCLRAPITGVGPMTGLIQSDLELSAAGAGMLTTIPLLVFAALSVLMGRVSERISAGRCLMLCMAVLSAGVLARSLLGSAGLYIGTVFIGIGITGGNVLIPGIVKAYYPDRVGLVTGVYATVMTAMGGVSSGISLPIAQHIGWKLTLMIWIIFAVIAFLVWIPNQNCSTETITGKRDAPAFETPRRSVSRSPMAWAIVFYFGIQSLVFYCFAAWLPMIMQAKGFDPVISGYFSSAFILVGIPATFIVPIFSARKGDESVFNVIIGLMFTLGMVLMFTTDRAGLLLLAVISSGLAVGACFSQAMALFGMRTRDAHDASALSGLAQSVGYLFAAVGPALAGWSFDMTGGWTAALVCMAVLAGVETLLGYTVGKERIIFQEKTSAGGPEKGR